MNNLFFINIQPKSNISLFSLLLFVLIINLLLYHIKKNNSKLLNFKYIFDKFNLLYSIIYTMFLLISLVSIIGLIIMETNNNGFKILNNLFFDISNIFFDPINAINSVESIKIRKTIFIIVIFNIISTTIFAMLFSIKIFIESKINTKKIISIVLTFLSLYVTYNISIDKNKYQVSIKEELVSIDNIDKIKDKTIFANEYIIKYKNYGILSNKNIEYLTSSNGNYIINNNSKHTLIDKLLSKNDIKRFFIKNDGNSLWIGNYEYIYDYDLTFNYRCNTKGNHDLRIKLFYKELKVLDKELIFDDYIECKTGFYVQDTVLNLPILPQSDSIILEIDKSESYSIFISDIKSPSSTLEYNILSLKEGLYENINFLEDNINIYSIKDIIEIELTGSTKQKLDLIYSKTKEDFITIR